MKKLLISFLLSLFFLAGFIPYFSPILAQSPSPASNPFTTGNETWYTQGYPSWFTKVYDKSNPTEIFGERYTAAQVLWIVYALSSIPLTPISDVARCAFTQDLALCTSAVNDLTANLPSPEHYANNNSFWQTITSRRSPSGIRYVQNLANRFVPVPSVYAQEGFGYNNLDMVREMWQLTRNLAFGLLVIVALYYSFMIMFRQKISPQAVITIESAIPKLIVSVLLITFSYAIAGFFIDIMYVIAGIVNFTVINNLPGIVKDFSWGMFTGSQGGVLILVYMALYFIAFFVGGVASLVALLLSSVVNAILSPFLAIIGLFVLLGVAVVLFINLFKTLFMMIKTAANIYIAVIFAPVQLAFGGIAKSSGFGEWAKNLIANLLVFPLMLLLLFLAAYFLVAGVSTGVVAAFASNFITAILKMLGFITTSYNAWSVPFLGNGWEGFIFMGVSFTIISAIPKAAEMAKSAIMKGAINFESGVGESFGIIKGTSSMLYGAAETRGLHNVFSKIADIEPLDVEGKKVLDPNYLALIEGKRTAASSRETIAVLLRNLAKSLASGKNPV